MGRPLGSKNVNKLSVKERILKGIQKPESGCWEYKTNPLRRYPIICIDRKTYKMSRISYEIFSGEKIPDGLCVLHKCDNTKCVNPEHLFLGTHQQNMDDMIQKGRDKKDGPKGTRCATHKLKEHQVLEIRDLIKADVHKLEIAKKYNVSETAIYHIAKRETWSHI
jgi:hypothetical protein